MATILFNPIGPPFDFSLTGGASGPVDTLTGNDGVVVNPIGNNINVIGLGTNINGTSTAGNIFVTGSNSGPNAGSITINETQAQFLTNYRQIGSSGPVLATDYLVGCTADGITVTLEAAPGTNRILVIKDESGTATATPTTISGNGKTIDGTPTISLDQNYMSFNLYFNGTNWFTY